MTGSTALSNARIVLSTCRNPFWNLCLEDYVFRKGFTDPFLPKLILYVNDPCVVVGRNQNPWRECNIPLIKSLGIPIVRRRSGGGTVVHDRGNVNFSIMTSRNDFSRDKHALMVCEALNAWTANSAINSRYDMEQDVDLSTTETMVDFIKIEAAEGGSHIDLGMAPVPPVQGPGVSLAMNERYDIVTEDRGLKVSGSAYKIERDRAYHHGTMLLDSKLDVLRACLHRDVSRLGHIEGRGVESVKSPVTNIGCDREVFVTAVVDAFKQMYNIDQQPVLVSPETLSDSTVARSINEASLGMKSWEWSFGQTPDFTHSLRHPELDTPVTFTVKKGYVDSVAGLPDTQIEAGKHRYIGRELSQILPPRHRWTCNAIDGWSDELIIDS